MTASRQQTTSEQAPKSAHDYQELLTNYNLVVAALHENEIRYQSLFKNNMDAIFLTVPDGTINAANPAACTMLDMTEAEICRAGRQEIVAPHDGQAARLEERLRMGKITLEQELIRRDGTKIICEVSSVVLPGNEPLSFVIAHDITERKESEKALRQSEQLAAVGRLAASIAHEINNPLASVTNLLYLARASHDLSEIQGYLTTAERELRRLTAISSQTLRFHKQSTKPRSVMYQDLVESLLSLHEGRLVNAQVEVSERYRATVPVLCLDSEIRQAINNLVGNAIDAMPKIGGRLVIRSRDATLWTTGQKGIALTIADNGSGIGPLMMKDLFKAFFTTKGIGGTGLGLWVSKEIIERHHGTIRVRSSSTRGAHSGTVVALFLPFDAMTRPV